MASPGEGDKRSVNTDALATLGTLSLGEHEGRDAIHLAVEPVIAPCDLKPGQAVNADGTPAVRGVGIVDPFIIGTVPKGAKFWLVVYPRQITSLRHVWSHPAFPDEESKVTAKDKAKAEEQLRRICEDWDGPGYETLIELAVGEYVQSDPDCGWDMNGEYLSCYGSDAHGEITPIVWDLVETVTGKPCVARPKYFSCSC